MSIKKCIITAAGLGTRFLPFTKSIAKEMLPIIDRPNIEYLIREAKNSGIEEVIIIVSKSKPEIEDYFKRNIELENILISDGKIKEANEIKEIAELVKIKFVLQEKPIGLANALYVAKQEINGEDFALILGDDLIYSDGVPALKQLIDAYEKYDSNIIGVQKVDHDKVNKYGIVAPKSDIKGSVFELSDLVEKPKIEDAPSDYAIIGRYIIKNNLFNYIEKLKPGKNNEYQLTDAFKMSLNDNNSICACVIDGERFDIGDKKGFVEAIDFYFKLYYNWVKKGEWYVF